MRELYILILLEVMYQHFLIEFAYQDKGAVRLSFAQGMMTLTQETVH